MRKIEMVVIALRGVTNRRIPGTPTIKLMIPGNGMVGSHLAATIGLLINGHQYMNRIGWITGEVVPLIGAHPLVGQVCSRKMMMVNHMYRPLLKGGMIVEEGPHQF